MADERNAMTARQESEGLTLRVAENTTGYFGVCLNQPGKPKPYQARVRCGGKLVQLGRFATAEEAALCVARSLEARPAAEQSLTRSAVPALYRTQEEGEEEAGEEEADLLPPPLSPPPLFFPLLLGWESFYRTMKSTLPPAALSTLGACPKPQYKTKNLNVNGLQRPVARAPRPAPARPRACAVPVLGHSSRQPSSVAHTPQPTERQLPRRLGGRWARAPSHSSCCRLRLGIAIETA